MILEEAKAVLFDLDGVIIDTASIYERIQKDICIKNKIPLNDIDWSLYNGVKSLDIFKDIIYKAKIININSEEINKQFIGQITTNIESYITLNRYFVMIAKILRNKGIKVGLVTSNSSFFVQKTLEMLGIENYFDTVVACDDVRETKPSPESYLLALKRMGVENHGVFAIEDSDVGIESAIKAGLRCIKIGKDGEDSISKELIDFCFDNMYRLYLNLFNCGKKAEYTLFTLKKDAIERGLVDNIISDISQYYEILEKKTVVLTDSDIASLKNNEWINNWKPYPSEEVKKMCYAYESGNVLILLCRIKNSDDAIIFGKKLKGNHHLAHKCSVDTIRGKYADVENLSRIHTDENGVSYLCDDLGKKISYAPNIIHAVDNIGEFKQHLELFFPYFFED